MGKVKCRAKVSADCYDGKDEFRIYGEDGQHDDGTWNGESVCDACYIKLGQPLLPSLERAITMARGT